MISRIRNKRLINKKAQVSVFIILGIIVIGLVVVYFGFKQGLFKPGVPMEMEPVYSYYLSCIKEETSNAASIIGQTGGYIELPEFSSGSTYMPSSSQLDFLGTGVPYWYYISGNGIVREQVPSIEKIESQLNDYLKERISQCDFSEFEKQGFVVSLNVNSVNSIINNNSIDIDLSESLIINYGNLSWSNKETSVEVNSNLGKFYSLARKIYASEKESMFLENYGVDILRLYAPVDGVSLSCNSQIWNINDIRNNLTIALESNIPATKIKGNYYRLNQEVNKYFEKDIGENVDSNINFMFSRTWPMKLEVYPSEDGILKADPVGLDPGMAMLGFCYVPYHFVYDFAYPVLIQIYSQNEIFQFPVVIYINKNQPRDSIEGEALPDVVSDLCNHKLVNYTVSTYDKSFNPVNSLIKFKCFDTSCEIGKTSWNHNESSLSAAFPQCVNGYIIAIADGYGSKKQLVSEGESNIYMFLDKEYNLDLEIMNNGKDIDNYALVSFDKNGSMLTLSYPDQKNIKLTEGQYKIKVYVYSNPSNILLKGNSSQKCVDVPKSGVLGYLGYTEQKCFIINIPDQTIEQVISGGGSSNYYISDSEIQSSKKIIINSQSLPIPRSVADLQNNYNSLEVSNLDIVFE